MKFAILLPILILVFSGNIAFGQRVATNSNINETESALLDILSKDSINPLQIKLDGEVFKFGLQVLTNSKISLLKKQKRDLYPTPRYGEVIPGPKISNCRRKKFLPINQG